MSPGNDSPRVAPCDPQPLQLGTLKNVPRPRLVQTIPGHARVAGNRLIAQESTRQRMRRRLSGVGTRCDLSAHASSSLSDCPQMAISLNDPHCPLHSLTEHGICNFAVITQARLEWKHSCVTGCPKVT